MRGGRHVIQRGQGVVLRVHGQHPGVNTRDVRRNSAGGCQHQFMVNLADAAVIDVNAVLARVEIVDDGAYGIRLEAGPFLPILDDNPIFFRGSGTLAA